MPGAASLPTGQRAEPTDAVGHNTETYDAIVDNAFQSPRVAPLSTFSIDVDTASYANVRRFLQAGELPPHGAVRIEELLNYFSYNDPAPDDGSPFSVGVEVAACPWKTGHLLARIGLKGREISAEARPASNLVFLIDVSGSMAAANKLPLVQRALAMLVERLNENDRVAIVVYAGAVGLVLDSTSADRRAEIMAAIESLSAGGSTNGAGGIALAYQVAEQNFISGGVNRVVLCTDGDFNVGITSQDELTRLIGDKAQSGVFLSVLGFGMGNYKDSTLEKLADRGNGSYGYVDSLQEARKLLVEQMTGTLITIAKDVKIQVEFNPAQVAAYRLIGYENRLLQATDFLDDRKDAGEIGAGHTVTALYELTPAGADLDVEVGQVLPLKYQAQPLATDAGSQQPAQNHDLFTIQLRYKLPESSESTGKTVVVTADAVQERGSDDWSFAAGVAAFGMLLRESPHRGEASFALVEDLALPGLQRDPQGRRAEFLRLAKIAQQRAQAKRK